MKDRINKILQDYSLSSTKLADKLNVQRSSISHILSGRNKPGFDFIQKLLRNYPEINAKWLILGDGPMYTSDKQPTLPFSESSESTTPRESNIRSEPNNEYQIRHSQKGKQQKKVKKIVFFFDDYSFETYHPSEE